MTVNPTIMIVEFNVKYAILNVLIVWQIQINVWQNVLILQEILPKIASVNLDMKKILQASHKNVLKLFSANISV